VVEHNLAKVGVEGSNPFARSNYNWLSVRVYDLKHLMLLVETFWLGGRVVMQRPAKPCTPVRFRPQPSNWKLNH
jgi:hypothetical protein